MNCGFNLFLNQPCLFLPYKIKSLCLYRLCMAAYLFEIEFTDSYVFIYFALTYNLNVRGSDTYRGSNCLWIRTLDRYTRAGLPKCVVSTMSGSPPGTARDRTQDKGHTPNPRIVIKIPDPAGNRTRVAGLEGRDSTDHATATWLFCGKYLVN